MEKLLNALIEKGWKPYNLNTIEKAERRTEFWFTFTTIYKEKSDVFTVRELVSKESWLWQFVCENRMVNKNKQYSFIKWSWKWKTDEFNQTSFQYFIIESALTDEDKLEDFILQNVKVDEWKRDM